tara:strand:+ start:2110 stop:2679 length:570 start_codon:yes stop_codon:yes gene_type:complete
MENSYSLSLIIGPMFSGKSTEIINRIKKLKNISPDNILIVNHTIDDRYGNNKIITHDNKSLPCIQISKINHLIKTFDLSKIKYLFIDEGQFYENLFGDIIEIISKYNIHITISGLDSDYNMNPFQKSNMLGLIPYASNLVKLNSICIICNKKAETTCRVNNDINNDINNQILVGSSDLYKPICFKCRVK